MTADRGVTRPFPNALSSRAGLPAGYALLRLPGGRGVLVHRRSSAVALLATLVAVIGAVVTITTGAYEITPGDSLRALAGQGSPIDLAIVRGQRLPRVLAAAGVGIALAGSGAIFQSVSRNELGSP
ncbi:iron chelate uptake ABC transporter family permease subunit, partial [Dietzia sp.]|uniref:iron chelate uptake ABC transporter family permease subunit n=1 Tax=Dietzia sp. TaxID=1871616 RepID=UPI002FD8934B